MLWYHQIDELPYLAIPFPYLFGEGPFKPRAVTNHKNKELLFLLPLAVCPVCPPFSWPQGRVPAFLKQWSATLPSAAPALAGVCWSSPAAAFGLLLLVVPLPVLAVSCVCFFPFLALLFFRACRPLVFRWLPSLPAVGRLPSVFGASAWLVPCRVRLGSWRLPSGVSAGRSSSSRSSSRSGCAASVLWSALPGCRAGVVVVPLVGRPRPWLPFGLGFAGRLGRLFFFCLSLALFLKTKPNKLPLPAFFLVHLNRRSAGKCQFSRCLAAFQLPALG